MSLTANLNQLREQLRVTWLARTEQERTFLSAGGAVVVVALIYSVLIGPALSGRAQLEKALPELRQKAAQMAGLGAEAAELARQPATQPAPMTREALAASLSAR